MRDAYHIPPRDLERVRPIVRAAYPDYTGAKVTIESATEVEMLGNYWQNGSRSYWTFVDLATMRTLAMPDENPLRTGGHAHTVVLPPNVVGVERHFFGTSQRIRIYARPESLTPLLPAGEQGALSDDENIVLLATACLKSSYGGIRDFRFNEASRRHGITRERWDASKISLQARGLLNKAGAITAEGRNAIANHPKRWSF